jgi:NADH-quinone oxidoreductase subunit M
LVDDHFRLLCPVREDMEVVLSRHALSLVLLTPLAGALVVLGMRRTQAATRGVAGFFAIAAWLLSLPLWFRYDPSGPTWQFTERADLLPGIGAAYSLGVDGYSISLVLLTTLVGVCAFVASWRVMAERANETAALMLLLEVGLLGVLVATDTLLYFLSSVVALLTAIALVRRWTGAAGGSAVRVVTLHMALAAVALLAGILLLSLHASDTTGAMTFDMVKLLERTIPPERQKLVFLAWFVSFATLSGLFPLQSWLPAAVGRAPAGGALLLAVAPVQLGAYGFMRLSLPLLPDAARVYAPHVTGIAVVSLLVSIGLAFRQREWKPVVALMTAAGMAVVLAVMFRLTPGAMMAGILQQASQTMAVAGFLLVAGLMSRERSVDEWSVPTRSPRAVFVRLLLVMAVLTAGTVMAAGRARPAAFHRLVETSVGRVVARINPAYAPLVKQPSDCGSPAPAVEPSSAAASGWVTTLPCADPLPKPPQR